MKHRKRHSVKAQYNALDWELLISLLIGLNEYLLDTKITLRPLTFRQLSLFLPVIMPHNRSIGKRIKKNKSPFEIIIIYLLLFIKHRQVSGSVQFTDKDIASTQKNIQSKRQRGKRVK